MLGSTAALVDTLGSGDTASHTRGLLDTATGTEAWSGVLDVGATGSRVTFTGDDVVHAGPGLLTSTPGEATRGNGVRAYAAAGPEVACGADNTYLCPRWWSPVDGTRATSPVVSVDGATYFVGTEDGRVVAFA